MDYSFNAEIAKVYGVDEAVFIHNLYWWIVKNEANGRHFYDGRNWTYNSMEAFSKLFPFWTKRQVERIIRKLKDNGAILVGNYNTSTFDRTQWYALSQEVMSVYVNGEMCVTKYVHDMSPNGEMTCHQTVTTIPDIKPYSKPDNKLQIDTAEKSACLPYKEIIQLFSSICVSFPNLTKLSDARKKAIKARLNGGYTLDDFKNLFTLAEESDFLKGKNDRNWQATFDWLIKDANMAKVLDGNYVNKADPPRKKKQKLMESSYDIDEIEEYFRTASPK